MEYREVSGDLISLAKQGNFDIIAHGCNCFCVMGAGLALQIKNHFPEAEKADKNYDRLLDAKLGNMSYAGYENLIVCNLYTQYEPGPNLDYEALTLCLRKLNYRFKGFHIGLPQIGCGIAGGDWERVKAIIQKELVDMNVTIVIYQP